MYNFLLNVKFLHIIFVIWHYFAAAIKKRIFIRFLHQWISYKATFSQNYSFLKHIIFLLLKHNKKSIIEQIEMNIISEII